VPAANLASVICGIWKCCCICTNLVLFVVFGNVAASEQFQFQSMSSPPFRSH
jgi:hypothetical protein